MRRIPVERARQKKSLKRGAGAQRINLDDVDVATATDDESLLIIDEALQKLKLQYPEAAEFIPLRFFAGLTNSQASSALGLSERSARRNWTFYRFDGV